MIQARMRLSGKRVIESFLDKVPEESRKLAWEAVKETGQEIYAQVIANASRRDHTLADLKSQNHPFARRHGSIQTAKLGGDWATKPWMVHKREGRFVKNIVTLEKNVGGKMIFRIKYLYKHKNVRRIVTGKGGTFPRNVIGETYALMRRNAKTDPKKILKKKAKEKFDKSSVFAPYREGGSAGSSFGVGLLVKTAAQAVGRMAIGTMTGSGQITRAASAYSAIKK